MLSVAHPPGTNLWTVWSTRLWGSGKAVSLRMMCELVLIIAILLYWPLLQNYPFNTVFFFAV